MSIMSRLSAIAISAALVFCLTGAASADCLECKSCAELLRLAQIYQEDLKTVNTVLGSAIEYGSMERIKNYKLKKGSVQREMQDVMRAIGAKGCVLSR